MSGPIGSMLSGASLHTKLMLALSILVALVAGGSAYFLIVIAISASASESDVRQSLAAGMNAFVPKPVDFGKLLSEIATLLQLGWRYELQQAEPSLQEDGGQLVAPPAQEMEALHRLARMGNMQDIAQQAGRIAELDKRYRAFADHLRALAQGYQSKAVLNLVEQYMKQDETP